MASNVGSARRGGGGAFAAKGLHVAIDRNSNPPAAIATLMSEITRKMKLTWE